MSDTPETDAVIAADCGDSGFIRDLCELSRKLERERDEARKERDDYASRAAQVVPLVNELRSANAAIGKLGEDILSDAVKLRKERDELRASLERANKDNAILAGRLTECEHERDALGAEVERLKSISSPAPAAKWQLTPPGPGLWWHTKSSAQFAHPHALNVTRDGVLRSGSVTDAWGTFVRADELGGYWWPIPLITPKSEVPSKKAEVKP